MAASFGPGLRPASSAPKNWLLGQAAGLALALLSLAVPAQAIGQKQLATLPRQSIGLGLSAYRPVLTTDLQTEGSASYFTDGHDGLLQRYPPMLSGQYTRYLWDDVGLLGVYARAGFWRKSGPSRICFDDKHNMVHCSAQTIATSQVGNDSWSLTVVPVGIGVQYRWDMLYRQRQLPLSLAARAGVDFSMYWSRVGSSPEIFGSSRPASGGNWGLSGALQVAYALNALRRGHRPYGTRAQPRASYVYAEVGTSWASGLGVQHRRIDLSQRLQLAVGVAFETP